MYPLTITQLVNYPVDIYAHRINNPIMPLRIITLILFHNPMVRYVFHKWNANAHKCNCMHAPAGVKICPMKVKLCVTKFIKAEDTHI